MAVYGNTIYIAFIFDPNVVANWSIGQFTYPGLTVAPSVDIVTSTNGGSTWSSPVTLPGLNSSAGNWSSNPSIAVTSTGTVYVAYDTNRTCELYCYYPGDSYFAEDIVLSTSVNNGTTWSSPVTVGGKSGENPNFQNFYDYYGYGFEGGWQLGPQTSIAVGATAATIYVGYSGTYSKSLTYPYYNWGYNGVFAAVSTNSGASWTNTAIQAPLDTSNYDDVYSPGVAYSAGTVYLAFVWQNN